MSTLHDNGIVDYEHLARKIQVSDFEYVFSESIYLLLEQILSLETCFRSPCSVDMFHGTAMII